MKWVLVLYFFSGGTAVHGSYWTRSECEYQAHRVHVTDPDVRSARCEPE